nr:Gag-Pol polyprotein [Tanacetum cinerariifolium]
MEDKIQKSKEGDSNTKEATSIQMEKEFQSNDSFEVAPEHDVNETNESKAPATQEGEPSTFQEAPNNPDASKPIGNKLMYKIKKNTDDQVERYRARLVVKGYVQKEGIDFNKNFNFFPLWFVVRMTTVRVVLAMCATYDLHLEQLDVKAAFLHGNLEEEIYMLQPEGFEQNGKENFFCSKEEMMEMSRVPYASAWKYNVCNDLYETRHCTCRRSNVALCFEESDLIVKGYVDSDYVGDIDGSKSAAQASKEAVWLKMLLEELGHEQEKITLFCDNQSAIQHFIQRQIIYEFSITSFVRKWKKEPWICRKFILMITWLTKAINCDKFC